MTTLVAFQPNPNSAPPFQATITMDGSSYNLTTLGTLKRGGYYVNSAAQEGTVEGMGALVGSPPAANIYLAPGVFQTSTILYRPSTGNFEINP